MRLLFLFFPCKPLLFIKILNRKWKFRREKSLKKPREVSFLSFLGAGFQVLDLVLSFWLPRNHRVLPPAGRCSTRAKDWSLAPGLAEMAEEKIRRADQRQRGRSKLTLQTNIHRGIVVRLPEEGRARKHAALCCVNTRAVAEYGWKRVQWKTNLRVCASLDALSQPSIKPKCVYVCGDRFTAKKKRRMSPFLLNHMPTDHKYGVSVLPSFLPRVERGEPKGVVGKDDPHNSSAWFGSKWSFLPS